MTKSFTFIATYLLLIQLFGQGYTFRVASNPGKSEVRRGTGEVLPMQVGTILYGEDIILPTQNISITLRHQMGWETSLDESRPIQVSLLARPVDTEENAAVRRRVRYILNRMGEEGILSEKDGRSTFYPDWTTALVSPPTRTVEVFGKELLFRWELSDPMEEESTDTVQATNIFEEVLLTAGTREGFITLDMDAFDYNLVILGFVLPDGAQGREFGFKRVGPEHKPGLVKELESLQVLSMEEIDSYLARAEVFVKYGLLYDALRQYELALRQFPTSEEIQEKYGDFLVDQGMIYHCPACR